MNITHELIKELVNELTPKYPKHNFMAYCSNYDNFYTGIDVHAKTGGRQTMILAEEPGIRIIVDYDHRPVVNYDDPQMFEKIDKILSELLR